MNKQEEKYCNKLVPQHSELIVVVINVCGLKTPMLLKYKLNNKTTTNKILKK